MIVRGLTMAAAVLAAAGLSACDLGGGQQGAGTNVSVDASGTARAPNTRTFVNTRAQAVAPSLAQNYVGFQFDYPANWTVDPVTGTANARNFIKVVAPYPSGAVAEPENFAVGHFSGAPTMEVNAQLMPQLMGQLAQQFSGGFPGFQVVDQGQTQVNGMTAWQMRFNASPTLENGQIAMWGRVLIVPNPAEPARGVLIIMLATDSSTEVRSVQDVGERGQLPAILRSFRFTNDAATAPNNTTQAGPAISPTFPGAPIEPQPREQPQPQPDQGYDGGGYTEDSGGKPQ